MPPISLRLLHLATSLIALPVLALGPSDPGSLTVTADNAAKLRGISSYVIREADTSTPMVTIINNVGAEQAAIRFDRTRPSALVAAYSSRSMSLLLLFQSKGGRLDVTLTDGRRASWVFDAALRRWRASGNAADVLTAATSALEEVALASSALPPLS